jgi:hypothetical protein
LNRIAIPDEHGAIVLAEEGLSRRGTPQKRTAVFCDQRQDE